MTNLATEVARLKRELAQVKKGQRLSHGASIENAAVEVRDDTGSLRAIVGQQGDGTTGVTVVNGPPPPQPSLPIVASVLGGVTASWDGLFEDGAAMPLDWSRIEVHAATADAFTPDSVTLQSTIETAQGATVVVPCETNVYVRFVARSTSGTASTPSGIVGPVGPAPVVAGDLLDGIVTTVKLADDAVTAAKVALEAVTPEALSTVLADTVSQRWSDAMDDPTSWTATPGDGASWSIAPISDAPSKGSVGQAAGYVVARGTTLIPYDPSTLYRVSMRVRASAEPSAGPDTLYAGVLGVAADKTTLVNKLGANSTGSQFYVLASGLSLPSADGWKVVTGYLQGRSAPGATAPGIPAPSILAPTPVHDQVRYIAPYLLLNYTRRDPAGIMQVDSVTIEAVRTGVVTADFIAANQVNTGHIVAGAVTTAKLDALAVNAEKIAAGAVTTAKLDALAVTADKIAANTITAGKLAAGSVDATALKADAITGKTITGGTVNGAIVTGGVVQTAATGQRVMLNPLAEDPDNPELTVPAVELHSGLISQVSPGVISAKVNDGSSAYPYVSLRSPAVDAIGAGLDSPELPIDSELRLLSSQPGTRGGSFSLDANANPFASQYGAANIYGYVGDTTTDTSQIALTCFDGNSAPGGSGTLGPGTTLTMTGSEVQVRAQNASNDQSVHVHPTGVTVDGVLTVGNVAIGQTSITPSAANTPTSTTVFYNIKGTSFYGWATANTTVPGVRTPVGAAGVTGVAVSSVTGTSMVVTVNRENTTTTNINWRAEGK